MDKILSTLQGIIVIHYVENIVKGTTDPSVDYFRYALKQKKRYYLGIFPKRRAPPPFWEPLIQKKNFSVYFAF